MGDHQYDPTSDSLSFPDDTVVGLFDAPDAAASALDALIEYGIDAERIQVLFGEAGARRMDPSGERHGMLGQLRRVVQHFGDEEIEHIERQARELRTGNFLVAAPAEDEEERDEVASIMESHGGHFINHYTSWAVERLVE
jgi:hypothetical protein